MAADSNYYLNSLPDILYPSLNPKSNQLFDSDKVKNFFIRVFLSEDVFQNVNSYTLYNISGNDRPDNVAEKVYGDSRLDWVILVTNNIIDVYNEWPMSDDEFYKHLNEKYVDTNYSNIVHYETTEVRDSKKRLLLKAGLKVDSGFTFKNPESGVTLTPVKPISYLDLEREKNNDKRKIFILRRQYLEKLMSDFSNLVQYNRQSSQYIDKKTKSASRLTG